MPHSATSPNQSEAPRWAQNSSINPTWPLESRKAISFSPITVTPTGIGPRIALKAARDKRVTAVARPLLVGDPAAVEMHAKAAGLTPHLKVIAKAADADWSNGILNLLDGRDGTNTPVEFGKVDAA